MATSEGSSQVRVLSWGEADESQAKLLLFPLGLLRELNGGQDAFCSWEQGNQEAKQCYTFPTWLFQNGPSYAVTLLYPSLPQS